MSWMKQDLEATLVITAIVALASWLLSAEGPLGGRLREALGNKYGESNSLVNQLAPAVATGALSALGFFLVTELMNGSSYYTMEKYSSA